MDFGICRDPGTIPLWIQRDDCTRCMCVYICVCVCVCVYMYMYTYMCIYTHIPESVTMGVSVGISKHLSTNSMYSHTMSVSILFRVRGKWSGRKGLSENQGSFLEEEAPKQALEGNGRFDRRQG